MSFISAHVLECSTANCNMHARFCFLLHRDLIAANSLVYPSFHFLLCLAIIQLFQNHAAKVPQHVLLQAANLSPKGEAVRSVSKSCWALPANIHTAIAIGFVDYLAVIVARFVFLSPRLDGYVFLLIGGGGRELIP